MYRVKAAKDRPDFRVLVDLLFEPGRNVDTSGNCKFPNDRSWTDVYIRDRESAEPGVTAWVHEDYWDDDDNCLELIFHVDSKNPETAEAGAVYLYTYCGEWISSDDHRLTDEEISHLKRKHSKMIQRADESLWHNSSQNI